MSTKTDPSLATLDDILHDPTLEVEVSLDGPAYWADDRDANHPELRVDVRVFRKSEVGRIYPCTKPPTTNRSAVKSFASKLQGILTDQLETKMSEYKPLTSISDARKGGLCPPHRETYESFLRTKLGDISKDIGSQRGGRRHIGDGQLPDWLTFKTGDRLRYDHQAQQGHETTSSQYRRAANSFPCENTATGASFKDNCLCQTALGHRESQSPLAKEIQNRARGLTIEFHGNPTGWCSSVKAKWTEVPGSTTVASAETENQLTSLEPIAQEFLKRVRKTAQNTEETSGQSSYQHWEAAVSQVSQSGQFGQLHVDTGFIETRWRDLLSPSTWKKK